MDQSAPWWRQGAIYHIYPRSFMDGNGDGVGDLSGITAQLDYLLDLGVAALWLSPIYPSPMADFGYDVADYTDIHPLFGNLADFDTLVAEAHARGLKVMLDFVPNHSADQHPWFLESRSSRDNPKRDWYVWHDAAPDGDLPNNWLSDFGGPAWTWDEATGQYYYHAYLPAQPDLNWHNPALREAMFDVLRFWLDRGVDGFRLDAFHRLYHDRLFRDDTPNPMFRPGIDPPWLQLRQDHSTLQPELFQILAGINRLAASYGERLLVGELYQPLETLMRFYGDGPDTGIHLPTNFFLIGNAWEPHAMAEFIRAYDAALPAHGWPNWVLGNHDRPRVASRVGSAQARVAAMLLFTLRGTPTLYYGDELGMTDVPIPPERVQDPLEKNHPGQGFGRDQVRTPMPWSAAPHGGFSSEEPWLPLAADYPQVNVAEQQDDPASMLHLHRRLLALRRDSDALSIGVLSGVRANGQCLLYHREAAGEHYLVVLNLAGKATQLGLDGERGSVVLSTGLDRHGPVGDALELRADEGVVLRLA